MKQLCACGANDPAASTPRWWPDLFLRQGRMLLQVTPEQASAVMDNQRNAILRDGGGPGDVPNIKLHDLDGREIGHVSYNGRVWVGPREVPLPGQKTAAQHEAEGWADYKVWEGAAR